MIFIEIGAHHGQSLEVALNPKYGFDRFILFEPSESALKKLEFFKDSRVEIFKFGLGENDTVTKLYNSGAVSATLFQEKFKNQKKIPVELIQMRQSAKTLSPYLRDTKVFIRINCEGSEVKILKNLLEYKLLNRRHSILVDFDMLRMEPAYPIKKLIEELNQSKVKYYTAESFNTTYTKDSVRKWLDFELNPNFKEVNFCLKIKYHTKSYFFIRRRLYKLIVGAVPISFKIIFIKTRQRLKSF